MPQKGRARPEGRDVFVQARHLEAVIRTITEGGSEGGAKAPI